MRQNEIKGAPLLSEHMPVSVIERGDGFYVIETTFTDYHLNAAGSVHGGIIAAFLDCGIAGGGASSRNRGVGMYGVTITMNVNFVRSARAGSSIESLRMRRPVRTRRLRPVTPWAPTRAGLGGSRPAPSRRRARRRMRCLPR